MATESIQTGGQSNPSNNNPNSNPDYAGLSAQFVGGGGNPNIAPPAPAPAPVSSTTSNLSNIPSASGNPLQSLGGSAGGYVGAAAGGAIGGAVGGGASIGSAIGSTANNIGTVLKNSTPSFLGGSSSSDAGNAVFGTPQGSIAYLGADGTPSALGSSTATGGTSITNALSNAGNTAISASTLGSAAGAGIGAGLGSEIIGAATTPGSFFKNLGNPQVYDPAIASGVGSAVGAEAGAVIGSIIPGVGTAIGAALGGAIGGGLSHIFQPVESAIGRAFDFCHAAGTMIRMEDGTSKAVEDLVIGDRVLLGGEVIGRGEVRSNDLWDYRGTIVSGRHAVWTGTEWKRVIEAPSSTRHEDEVATVYPIVTEKHLLVCEDYVCADFAETDDFDMSPSQRLARLNAMTERNKELRYAMRLLGLKDDLGRAAATAPTIPGLGRHDGLAETERHLGEERSPVATAQMCSDVAACEHREFPRAENIAARELVQVMRATDQFKAQFPTIMQALKAALVQGRPEMEKDFDAILLAIDDGRRVNELGEAFAVIYASNFSVSEIHDIAAFYRSPTGQKFLAQQPVITQESVAAGQRWVQALSSDLKEAIGEQRGAILN
jgi:uncharacterized protein